MEHDWLQCSNCKQEREHDYKVKDADKIANKTLLQYANVYCYRKTTAVYLFAKDADKECPSSAIGKHNWQRKVEVITVKVSNQNLKDFEKKIQESERERNKERCESYYSTMKSYRTGVVNSTINRICLFLEYTFDESVLNEHKYYWDNLNLPELEALIFSKSPSPENNDLKTFLYKNAYDNVIKLYELINSDKLKISIPITEKEIEYYGYDIKNCDIIKNIKIDFSLNPNILKVSDDYFAEIYSSILNLAYARALGNVGRKKEAIEIFNKTDMLRLFEVLPTGYRPKEYYFARMDNPGSYSTWDNEPDEKDRAFCIASIISYLKLCNELNETPKFSSSDLKNIRYQIIRNQTNWIDFALYSAPNSVFFENVMNSFFGDDKERNTPEGNQLYIIHNLLEYDYNKKELYVSHEFRSDTNIINDLFKLAKIYAIVNKEVISINYLKLALYVIYYNTNSDKAKYEGTDTKLFKKLISSFLEELNTNQDFTNIKNSKNFIKIKQLYENFDLLKDDKTFNKFVIKHLIQLVDPY